MLKVVTNIKNQQIKLNEKLKKIQDECLHPKEELDIEYDGNTGNYDLTNYYWTKYHCKLCDKSWTEYTTEQISWYNII